MPIFDGNLPYTNLHELNNDWVVKTVKEVKDKTDELDETLAQAKEYSENAKSSEENAELYAQNSEDSYNDITDAINNWNNDEEYLRNQVSQNTTNIGVNSARIDAIVSGTTPDANAELIDIRVAYDGNTYNSAGESVRAQAQGLANDINELNVADYLKLYNMTMADNRGVRFVALAKVFGVITTAHIEFDYDSTPNMNFGQWRIVLYGGSNTAGAVGTELYSSGPVVGYQHHFSVDASVSNTNSYDYAQFFIEFIYPTVDYADNIILNNFKISINGFEKELYGCNTWNYSHHSCSYTWKSNLIPAYALESDLPSINPQLIVSIIDDDSTTYAPTIWNAILQGNDDVKIGFACITGYMNGSFPGIPTQYTQMTLNELKTFYNNGHEVYSHGWGGYSYRPMSLTDTAKECWKSKDWLFANGFVRGLNTIVYSGGADNVEDKMNVTRGYYNFGVNAWGGGINEEPIKNALLLNRYIGDTATLAQMTSIVDSYMSTGGILVFGFHSYNLSLDQANNIQKIRDLITYIKGKGITITPLEQAMKSMYGFRV